MASPVVVVGIGELGGVFARGLLRTGHVVHPVTRETSLLDRAASLPDPELVLVTVGEADLDGVLAAVPPAYRQKLALVQNELVPARWRTHDLPDPTVAVVWFEKKPGMDVKVLLPTVAHGPAAPTLVEALGAIGIAARVLDDDSERLFEMVRKNLYILVTNIAGLRTGGTVGELWATHRGLVEALASEVLDIQAWLTASPLPREKLVQGLLEAFEADPDHKCTGRSAPGRLERALDHANEAALEVPTLRAIAQESTRG